jgi:hypothetical protein
LFKKLLIITTIISGFWSDLGNTIDKIFCSSLGTFRQQNALALNDFAVWFCYKFVICVLPAPELRGEKDNTCIKERWRRM